MEIIMDGWMGRYELGETGEISVIVFMSFACFAPSKYFYTIWILI
jgi:hypothetical protein